jgi:hypothetical protein
MGYWCGSSWPGAAAPERHSHLLSGPAAEVEEEHSVVWEESELEVELGLRQQEQRVLQWPEREQCSEQVAFAGGSVALGWELRPVVEQRQRWGVGGQSWAVGLELGDVAAVAAAVACLTEAFHMGSLCADRFGVSYLVDKGDCCLRVLVSIVGKASLPPAW